MSSYTEDLKLTVKACNLIIDDWRFSDSLTLDDLPDRRKLAGHLDYLQRIQSVEYKKFLSHKNQLIKEGESNVSAVSLAEEKYPLSWELRRRIRSIKDSIKGIEGDGIQIMAEMKFSKLGPT